MSVPDVDEVVNYLSIKFNKIFCDRDFVCCVIEDFQTILNNKNKPCILVFPTLGPIYLKALRYQARIFDLTVFNITSASGKFKSIAVCHKDHIKTVQKDENMPEPLSKRKRPERQLYVPPAQRVSRLSKQCDKKVTPESIRLECQKSVKSDKCCVLSLSDVNFLNVLHSFTHFQQSTRHANCEFKKYLQFNNLKYNHRIKIYNGLEPLNAVSWNLNQLKFVHHTQGRFKSYPVFDLEICDVSADTKPAILVNCATESFLDCMAEFNEFDSYVYKVECDHFCDLENCHILDLSVQELGHFYLISVDNSEYFYECQEKHDVTDCCKSARSQLELSKNFETLIISTMNNNDDTKNNESNKKENETNGTTKTEKDIVKNKINNNQKKDATEYEKEKEIMRMTKEYMNRKTRPIMKYVDDSEDNFRIDKNDSVNNWEDLFDDNGEIQENLLTEIVDKVGDDITIVKASEDYTAYTNKPPEDLEHVVELYNFPSTLETHDLVQAFSDINSDAMYIKWVDDTHALLVLGSLSQAQKAISLRNPLIKVRPMTAASAISMDVANKSDLKPAMKRPQTNLQTARRLITSHLGTKSKLTKEQIAKEKQDLKNAREMKRLLKQNEKDAWEGNLRSTVN